jgi:hypothetical protein
MSVVSARAAVVETIGDRAEIWRTGGVPPLPELMVLGELAQAAAEGTSDVALEEVGMLFAARFVEVVSGEGRGLPDRKPRGGASTGHRPGCDASTAIPPPSIAALPKNAWLVCYCACPHAESSELARKLLAAGFSKITVLDEGAARVEATELSDAHRRRAVVRHRWPPWPHELPMRQALSSNRLADPLQGGEPAASDRSRRPTPRHGTRSPD